MLEQIIKKLAISSICLSLLAGCSSETSPTPTLPPASPTPAPSATPPPTDTPSPSPSPTITLTPTPSPIDYEPMIASIKDYMRYTSDRFGYDLGIGFVDVQTGQAVSIDGDSRYHAMSTFKGPLAAFYLWLAERGQIDKKPTDEEHIRRMLAVSSNPDTTCIFQQVGGIPPFNDWLAEQGFSRQNNFVLKWQEWACLDNQGYYIPELDWRYTKGDETLGLPSGGRLLECPIHQLPCDKAFAPVELAKFYARLYRGEVLSAEDTARLLGWMKRGHDEAVFLNMLPSDANVRVYIKGGTRQADETYRVNFFSEAGIVETEEGAFALAIFMQRNPAWPGTEPMSKVARITYDYFMATHQAPGN
jgi:beta-lactamase class A